jgi:hypothetical protein
MIMKRYLLGFCSVFVLLLTACDTWIDPKLNIDPNSPASASYDVVLPTAQAGMAYVLGGDFGRYASLLTQHNTGTDRQHLGIYNYTFTEADVNNAWNTMYSGPMLDLQSLIDRSAAEGATHYQGIFHVLQAYNLVTMTDLWGDIPYSTALQGSANTAPTYDAQSAIYASANSLLDGAIAVLSAPAQGRKPGADDLIYGGKAANWIKAANALKARMAIHLAKADAQAAGAALTALAGAISSNADDMQFTFGTAETEGNPWYQFNTQRSGDLTFGAKIAAIMNGTNDPRLAAYCEPTKNGNYNDSSSMGPFYSSINSAVPFLTFTEMKFIEAEAQMRLGKAAEAHAAFVAAVKASLARTGVSDADATAFLAQASVDPGATALTLENIMTQKYVAMYTQCESFSDWRRTGFPALAPVEGNEIPRRFPYPQSERLYNGGNMPAGLTIFSRVWWDK